MPIQSLYFKFRDPFNFSPHHFEIGNAIIQNKGLADNFFLKKLYDLEEDEYGRYYYFHFDYFSINLPDQEVYIMEIVTTLFRAKLTQGLADFWVAANAIKARTKIVI